MGLYDTFGRCQIKAGPCAMGNYEVGEKHVPLADGVYVCYEGIVVIVGGEFVAEFKTLTDKWGIPIDPEAALEARNPVGQMLKKMKEDPAG